MFDWFKKKPSNNDSSQGPDFSRVDFETAQKLFEDRTMEKLFLLPPVFGGEDIAPNMVYVPIGIAAVKDGIDNNVIAPLASDGKVSRYEASPQYKGSSVIPIRIKIRAYDPGEFSTEINIWGEAIKANIQ